jgi:hypothetical protein
VRAQSADVHGSVEAMFINIDESHRVIRAAAKTYLPARSEFFAQVIEMVACPSKFSYKLSR